MRGDAQRRTTSEIAQLAAAAGQLAIDTEFVSERRYRTLLCLVQVAVPDPSEPGGVRCEALDPLAGFDREPLARVLADPAVEVVMHAGRQDVALLRRELATDIRNLFDTQVAAGFAGFSAQEGYQTLVRQLVGVRIEGGEGFTRWDQRPLTEAQLRYALDDVRYLLALAAELKRRLEQLGRLEWAREESRAIEEISDARDPLDLRAAVAERVDGDLIPRHVSLDAARGAEIEASGQLAHDEQIGAAHDFGAKRRGRDEGIKQDGGAKIGEDAQTPPQLQQPRLGLERGRIRIEFRSADGAKEHGIALKTPLSRPIGERHARFPKGDSTDREIGQLEPMAEQFLDRAQDLDGLRDHLRPNAIAGQHGDAKRARLR